ncbi:MOSC N-terminal beta barrel domain-containing protein [Planktotalea sp.]|uniref:MOSC domain-containing protein n=1 Tax=Planktotalea sp. TaxID=2029877 RepID=UPI003299530F
MMGNVTSLWRHPIKSHGREDVSSTTLIAGHTMPGDRVWAVAHEASKADNSEWSRCANFTRIAKVPQLMAMTSRLDDAAGIVTLEHPELGSLSIDPDQDAQTFLDWVKPLMPADRAQSTRIVKVPNRGMTDSKFPSVTLCNTASHRAVEQQIGTELSIHRWRGNIWLDGFEAWEEFEWIDRDIRIGEAILRPLERTGRCPATKSNPVTGVHDADTLAALDTFGHRDFSMCAEVIQGGLVEVGSKVELL